MNGLSRRDRIAAQLADLKMPGALEALADVLAQVDGGGATAAEAIEELLAAQIAAAGDAMEYLESRRRWAPATPASSLRVGGSRGHRSRYDLVSYWYNGSYRCGR